MTKKQEKDYLAQCENTAQQLKTLHDALMSKGFTSDEAFKLVCLIIPTVHYDEV